MQEYILEDPSISDTAVSIGTIDTVLMSISDVNTIRCYRYCYSIGYSSTRVLEYMTVSWCTFVHCGVDPVAKSADLFESWEALWM